MIVHRVAEPHERLLQVRLEREAGMIRTDGNVHGETIVLCALPFDGRVVRTDDKDTLGVRSVRL